MAKAILVSIFIMLLLSSSALSKTIEGRVEMIEQGEQPSLPRELLQGGVADNGMPDGLRGMWYGDVEVTQMETYPSLHGDNSYSMQFIAEANKLFEVKKRGKVVLEIKRDRAGNMKVASSDVILRGGMKLQFTQGRGPALVPGGYNQPTTITNKVVATGGTAAEQTRVDKVYIVDQGGMPIAGGFSEISASYALTAPRKMFLRILEIDYDANGRPLWKILLKGTATR